MIHFSVLAYHAQFTGFSVSYIYILYTFAVPCASTIAQSELVALDYDNI